MQPLTCPGGYGVPMYAGNFTIKRVTCRAAAVGTATVVRLSDDSTIVPGTKFGKLPKNKTPSQRLIVDLERAVDTSDISEELNVRVTNGISPITTSNVLAGSLMVYVK